MSVATLRRAWGNPATQGGGGFDPLALAPAGWFKADVGVYQERTGAAATTPALLLADPVGTWQDQSGNARHLTAATDAARPSLQLGLQNGLPGLRLDGADDRLQNAALGALLAGTDVAGTLVYVSRANAPAGTFLAEWLLYSTVGNAAMAVYNAATATGMTLSRRDDGGAQADVNFTDDRSVFRILEVEHTGVAVTIRRNGVPLTTAALDVDPFTANQFSVGGGGFSGLFLGDILEFFVFPGVLAEADAGRLRTYLSGRFDIPVV